MKPLAMKTLNFSADLDQLSKLRQEIRDFLSDAGTAIFRNRIVFCLDELACNVIEHGTFDSNEKMISLNMLDYRTYWKFILTDGALAFDPRSVQSESLETLYALGAEGGFGLKTVKKLVRLHYRRIEGNTKNELTLYFRKENHE
jgi:serine/threonine-protein kinase RsbW